MIPEAVARAGKTLHARVASDHRSETMPTATRRCFAILNLVAHSPTAIDVADVVETLALPKATAYRLVEGLVSSGYLVREPVRKRLTEFLLQHSVARLPEAPKRAGAHYVDVGLR